MTSRPDLDRSISAWLVAEAPERAPEHLLSESRARIQGTRQRRSVWSRRPVWWAPKLGRLLAYGKLAAASAAVLMVVVVVGTQPPKDPSQSGGTIASGSIVPSPDPRPTSSPSAVRSPEFGAIDPGVHELAWPLGPSDARIRVTIPTGWSWMGDDGSFIYRDHGRLYGFPTDLATHGVTRVVTSVCPVEGSSGDVGPIHRDVGPSVDDLTMALMGVAGIHWSGPADVTVNGYPGKRLVSTYAAECPGPARRFIWDGDAGSFFVEQGVRASIYIIDVEGLRLVVTTEERSRSPEVLEELEEIVASIEIDRGQLTGSVPPSAPTSREVFPQSVGPDAALRIGRHPAIVEGIPFSFDIPADAWEPQLGFYISKSSVGAQGAEGTIRWTTLPDSRYTDPCPRVLDPSIGGSTADVAQAVATAPGVDVVTGPDDATIGGRSAMHVVFSVRVDHGCDPGYFYTYEPVVGGALWTHTQPGDTVLVWIVDVDRRLLFIEAELHPDAGPGLEQEIRQIVDSIRFE